MVKAFLSDAWAPILADRRRSRDISTMFSDPYGILDKYSRWPYHGQSTGARSHKVRKGLIGGRSRRAKFSTYVIALRWGFGRKEAAMLADYDYPVNLEGYYRARVYRLSHVLSYMLNHPEAFDLHSESDFRMAAEEIAEQRQAESIWDLISDT